MKVILLSALLASLGLVGGPSNLQAEIADNHITDVVERELLHEPAVYSNTIDIATDQGIVTLNGHVTSLLAKNRAARVAETVKGVRAVVNRLVVRPIDPSSDGEIRERVENALLEDPATDGYEVDVLVQDGVVTLSGSVQSWAEQHLCETVTAGVEGVLELRNDIHIDYESERPDVEIQNEIEEALAWSTRVDDALLDVAVQDGHVRLTGTVGSSAEKHQAVQLARTAGVTSVDDADLEVARWARDPDLRRDKYGQHSDAAIQRAVQDALVRDPRVFSFNVACEVSGGIVTLRGQVDNLRAKRAASSVARHTVGTVYVENHLKVRPPQRDDAAIEADLKQSIARSAYFSGDEIDVSCRAGEVVLEGSVGTNFEKALVDDLASRVNGVVRVRNHLDVAVNESYSFSPFVDSWATVNDVPWAMPHFAVQRFSDRRIEENIESELWWSPFVDEEDVGVRVEDGIATLTGVVESRLEWDAAQDNAYEAGATFVRNRLRIESDGAQASR